MVICIFGHKVSTAVLGSPEGGAELQAATIAKALASQGHSVVVVDPLAVEHCRVAENLLIEPVPGWFGGIRGLRLFTHRLPGLIHCLKKSQAGVFYTRGLSFHYLVPLYVAKKSGAKFVLAVASDLDLLSIRKRYATFYGEHSTFWDLISTIIPDHLASFILLKHADRVFTQHQGQADLLAKRGIPTIVLRNVIDDDVFRIPTGLERKNVVVVGSLSVQKNLGVLLPVVERLQNVTFEFIGDSHGEEGRRIRAALGRFSNVVLRGKLDRVQTLARIAQAKALANVSPREGFPNVFIEAWALRTPVISLFVDPGGVISKFGLGYCCHGNIEGFVGLLVQETYDLDLGRISEYVRKNHATPSVLEAFKSVSCIV
jgi:hypothetical protein